MWTLADGLLHELHEHTGWWSFSALVFPRMDPLDSLAGSQQPLGHTAQLLLCLTVLCVVQACHGPQSWWRRCSTSSSSTRGSWTFCSAPAPCCCVFWAKVGTRLDGEASPSWVLCLTSSSNFPLIPSICLSSLLFPSVPIRLHLRVREGIINVCIHWVYMGPETLDSLSLSTVPQLYHRS